MPKKTLQITPVATKRRNVKTRRCSPRSEYETMAEANMGIRKIVNPNKSKSVIIVKREITGNSNRIKP